MSVAFGQPTVSWDCWILNPPEIYRGKAFPKNKESKNSASSLTQGHSSFSQEHFHPLCFSFPSDLSCGSPGFASKSTPGVWIQISTQSSGYYLSSLQQQKQTITKTTTKIKLYIHLFTLPTWITKEQLLGVKKSQVPIPSLQLLSM